MAETEKEFFRRIGKIGQERRAEKREKREGEEGVWENNPFVPGDPEGCGCVRCVRARARGIA